MKFIKKALTLFLATCMSTSFFLAGCSKDEPEESENGGDSGQGEIESTGDFLLKNGMSSYKIVIPDDADADEILAGERLQGLFEEATNTLLPIVEDSTITSITADDKYILIGDNDFAVANGFVPLQTDVKSTGYTIKTKDNCIYIAGGASVGTLFGVYNFLGHILNYDYFAKEIYSLDKGVTELALYDYDVAVIPDCEVNFASYRFLTAAELRNYCMYAPETVNVRGMTGHNSLKYTLDNENDSTLELAMKNHPKWFSVGNVSEEDAAVNDDAIFASTQLCYTAHGDSAEYEKLYERMAQNIIDIMIADKDAVAFNCSVSDNHNNCDCAACTEEINKYGTPSGSVVKLLNRMAETVDAWMESDAGKPYAREWGVKFLAYNNYQNAPAKLVDGAYQAIDEEVVCYKRVVPYIAYVGADYTSSIHAEQNKAYKSQCEAWKSLANTVQQYIYAKNYKHYLLPYNSFGALSDLYKYFKGDNIYMLGDSNNSFTTGFDNLKIYLYGKLGVDVNANVEELIKKYFKNVYLGASDIMYNIFNEYRTNEQRLKEQYPNDFCATTSCYQTRFINSKYYESSLFEKWSSDIEKAVEKIEYLKSEDTERYEKVYKMILGERVWVNYFYWQTNRNNVLYDTLERMTNDLIHDIEYCGLSYTREGPMVTTSELIAEMKTFLGETKK